MAKKRKKSGPKCTICKRERKDPKDFAASLNKSRICISCALVLVAKL